MKKNNDKKLQVTDQNGYFLLPRSPQKGDKITIGLTYKTSVVTDDFRTTDMHDLAAQTVHGILQYGPYLMGVDDRIDPTFNAEPNDNVVLVKSRQPTEVDMPGIVPADAALYVQYQHGGYPSRLQTCFIPMAEQTYTSTDI